MLDKNVKALLARLRRTEPVSKLDKLLEQAQESLEKDIGDYFRYVDMYRAGVFAMHVKQYIERLHVGKTLDDVEDRGFGEEYKEATRLRALEELFSGISNVRSVSVDGISKLGESVSEILSRLRTLQLPAPESSAGRAIDYASKEEISQLLSHVQEDIERDIDEAVHAAQDDVASEVSRELDEYEEKLRALRKARCSRFTLFALGGGLIAGGVYGLIYFAGQRVGDTIPIVVGIGILTNLFGDIAGFLLGRFTDSFPRVTEERKRNLLTRIKDCVRDRIRSRIIELSTIDTLKAKCTLRLQALWSEEIENIFREPWKEPFEKEYETLERILSDMKAAANEYQKLIGDVCQAYRTCFMDDEKNLGILHKIAEDMESIAIEPSFSLLEGIREKLVAMEQSLGEVDFV